MNLIGLAAASTMLDTPDASSLLLESLVSSYNARHWTLIWLTLEFCAAYFQFNAPTGKRVLSCSGISRPTIPPGTRSPESVPSGCKVSRTATMCPTRFAQGEALDRDQLVHFVMEHLGQNPDSYYA